MEELLHYFGRNTPLSFKLSAALLKCFSLPRNENDLGNLNFCKLSRPPVYLVWSSSCCGLFDKTHVFKKILAQKGFSLSIFFRLSSFFLEIKAFAIAAAAKTEFAAPPFL